MKKRGVSAGTGLAFILLLCLGAVAHAQTPAQITPPPVAASPITAPPVAPSPVVALPAATSPSAAPPAKIPEFVDEAANMMNMSGMEPRQELVFQTNFDSFEAILKLDHDAVCVEMKRRLADGSAPSSVRLMEAAVLVVEKDEAGRSFFKAQFQAKNKNIRDVYWMIFNLWLRGASTNLPKTDLAWAEDMMLDALQDKTPLNRDEVYHANFLNEPKVEVRELAVGDGHFPEILGDMKSPKALPVLLAMLNEKNDVDLHWDRREIIGCLGDFGDRSVEPVLLDLLKKHSDMNHGDDTYRSAIHAAVKLNLKSAVPILMAHLDDAASYGFLYGDGQGGLKALADASVLPALQAALPTLKDTYAHAEDQLLIIQLQNKNVVPQLCTLFQDPNFPCRLDVYYWLERLKSDDAVPALTNTMCHDKEDYIRGFSIRILAATRTKNAVAALVTGLEANYSDVNGFKVMPDHDFNAQFRGQIADALKDITKQDFGTDAAQWRKWLETHSVN